MFAVLVTKDQSRFWTKRHTLTLFPSNKCKVDFCKSCLV